MLLTADMFAKPIPTFNINGETEVRTHLGGCISLLVMYVTFIFATLKLEHLLSRHNPSVNVFVDQDALSSDDIWSGAEEEDFMVAFAVVDYISGDPKNDKKFIKWFGQLIVADGDDEDYFEIPMHECTENDFKRFHKPAKTSQWDADYYSKEGGFMCIDWTKVEMQGNDYGSKYKVIDIKFLPCATKETLNGGLVDRIPEDCNYD